MGLLKPASGGSYLKCGILGFAKGGKTHTAMEFAFGVRRFFGLKGPVGFYDTEMGSDYWDERAKKETGQALLVHKSRSLVDLLEVGQECVETGVSVLVTDSITHVWREVCDAYLMERQAIAKKRGWRVPDSLEFSDWAPIKAQWNRWSNWFLTAPLHIIVCGRAGWEYDMETNERGKKELIKVDTKMKVESEFGFEPSLLIEMTREVEPSKDDKPPRQINRAFVKGDRFDLINGRTCDFPTFEFIKPFVERLAARNHAPVDTAVKTQFDIDEGGDDGWRREQQAREIASEKIKSAFQMAEMDGTSTEQKKRRAEAMQTYWGTTSWKELSEKIPSVKLMDGLQAFSAAILAAQESEEGATTSQDQKTE